MLNNLFLSVLRMSVTASYVILAVFVLRMFLKKYPKIFSYTLWSVVLFRLICPFSFESVVGLLPADPVPPSAKVVFYETAKQVQRVPQAVHVTPQEHVMTTQKPIDWMLILAAVWILGVIFLLAKNGISYYRLNRKMSDAVYLKENVYCSKQIETAFVLGVFRPKIYLLDTLSKEEQEYILLHEQTHIRRKDPLIKLVSFVALSAHWFNPLVWLAFFAASEDMEMSCDEAVIKTLGNGCKQDYSRSLLHLATGKRNLSAPLAFGEGNTKERIKNVLSYKKPALWVIILLAAVVAVVGIVLGFNQKEDDKGYAGLNAKIVEVDTEQNIIKVKILSQDSDESEYLVRYDDKTSIHQVQDGSPIVYSEEQLHEGLTVQLFIHDVKSWDSAPVYAQTIQIGQDEVLPENKLDAEMEQVIQDLWYKANNAYNVNAIGNLEDDVFEVGEAIQQPGQPEFYELLNYNQVVEELFTDKGLQQFEATQIGSEEPFIQKIEGKVYRLGPWKTGYSYEVALHSAKIIEQKENELTFLVEYVDSPGYAGADAPSNVTSYVQTTMKIVKEDGKWKVDDYVFPESKNKQEENQGEKHACDPLIFFSNIEGFSEAYLTGNKHIRAITTTQKADLEDLLNQTIEQYKKAYQESKESKYHAPWPEYFPPPSVLPDKVKDKDYSISYTSAYQEDEKTYHPAEIIVSMPVGKEGCCIEFTPTWINDGEEERMEFGEIKFYKK